MEIILYTTHCPQCKILTKKLDQKGVKYTSIDDIEVMSSFGLKAVPALCVDGGPLMGFKEAVAWVNSLEV